MRIFIKPIGSIIIFSLILLLSVPVLFGVGSNGLWFWVENTVTGTHGEAIVGTGTALYIARGTHFYRYQPSSGDLLELANPTEPDGSAFKTGTSLTWDFNNYIYALFGAATSDTRSWFYRYSISSNTWEALANTPMDQGEGDALAWVETEGRLYASIGGEQRPTYFMQYNPTTNSWSDAPTDPPGGMGDGASLVWAGEEMLYALRGEFEETTALYDFWSFNLSSNSWHLMANIPAAAHSEGEGGVGDGGSLLYVGFWLQNQTDCIYALSGNQVYPESIPDNRTYRYSISTNIWEQLADLPFGVGYYVGQRLGFADGRIYAWQGAPSTWEGGGDDLACYHFPPPHDIAVVDVVSSRTVVGQGYCFQVNATLENQGYYHEDANVTIYLNSTIVETRLFNNLLSGTSTIMMIDFVDVGFPPGNYSLAVYVEPVPFEIETDDNYLQDGWVFITIRGDIDGNRRVDIYDVVLIAAIYNSCEGEPQYRPNADTNCDGCIDIFDVVTATGNYRASW